MSIPQPLLKIKSIFILNKILSKFSRIRLLKLIKYNKNIQKKLNINIKKYRTIKIEIITNKSNDQFININK